MLTFEEDVINDFIGLNGVPGRDVPSLRRDGLDCKEARRMHHIQGIGELMCSVPFFVENPAVLLLMKSTRCIFICIRAMYGVII